MTQAFRLTVLCLCLALLSLPASILLAGRASDHPAGADFGQEITLSKITSLAKASKHPERYEDRAILVQAPVRKVCQVKGCWMVIGDGPQPVRVRFKEYAFFVPKDSAGHPALIQGVLSRVTIPEDVARHYAEDAGEDPSTIVGDQEGLEMIATGVRLLGYTVPEESGHSQTRPQSRPNS